MNRTILSPNDPIDLDEEETSFMQEFNKHYGYLSQSAKQNKQEQSLTPISNANTAETQL